jgi:transcriptional regulator of heat shock response
LADRGWLISILATEVLQAREVSKTLSLLAQKLSHLGGNPSFLLSIETTTIVVVSSRFVHLTGREVIFMAASNSGSVGRGKAFDRPP